MTRGVSTTCNWVSLSVEDASAGASDDASVSTSSSPLEPINKAEELHDILRTTEDVKTDEDLLGGFGGTIIRSSLALVAAMLS